jgi:hypothetical protein
LLVGVTVDEFEVSAKEVRMPLNEEEISSILLILDAEAVVKLFHTTPSHSYENPESVSECT